MKKNSKMIPDLLDMIDIFYYKNNKIILRKNLIGKVKGFPEWEPECVR